MEFDEETENVLSLKVALKIGKYGGGIFASTVIKKWQTVVTSSYSNLITIDNAIEKLSPSLQNNAATLDCYDTIRLFIAIEYVKSKKSEIYPYLSAKGLNTKYTLNM